MGFNSGFKGLNSCVKEKDTQFAWKCEIILVIYIPELKHDVHDYFSVKANLFLLKMFTLIRMKFSTIKNPGNMQSKTKMTSIIAICSILLNTYSTE